MVVGAPVSLPVGAHVIPMPRMFLDSMEDERPKREKRRLRLKCSKCERVARSVSIDTLEDEGWLVIKSGMEVADVYCPTCPTPQES
jgi:hypothetical protein